MNRIFRVLAALALVCARAIAAQNVAPLGIPMERMGSGTTWIPDAVPLPARHRMVGSWLVMLHGFGFVEYDTQGGPRGASQFGSLNWAMAMASRDFAGGRLQARTMLSLDPVTVSTRGYPLLLQSGETYRGQGLVDRQHPHDFWMELALMYERALSSRLGFSAYAAPSGEPALGPVAFMHRPSAMDNPVAPLGHHWQDATHISFGVLTAGVFGEHWKLEGSAFNGREPDEERWGLDRLRLDSYSARFSAHVNPHWTVSAGYGYLESPEVLHPGESVHRTTASVLYGRRTGREGQVALTLVGSVNRRAGQSAPAALAETELIVDRANTLIARIEFVKKSAEDLSLASFPADKTFDIWAVSGGYIRELTRSANATIGVGLVGTMNVVPITLDPIYGSGLPLGAMFFLRIRPLPDAHAMMGH